MTLPGRCPCLAETILDVSTFGEDCPLSIFPCMMECLKNPFPFSDDVNTAFDVSSFSMPRSR